MNILIIEDNHALAQSLKKKFLTNSFANIVSILSSFNDFLYHSSIDCYDIVLVDICLGKQKNRHGIDILRHIRKHKKLIPVIVMSSYDECTSLREAFSLGANDYIIKPFRNKELQVRMERWFYNYLFLEYHSVSHKISYYELDYCLNQKEFFIGIRQLRLSRSSKYILLLFVVHKESLLTRSFLVGKIWGHEEKPNTNLRIKILRLKKQLHESGIDSWIKAVRGEGYILKKIEKTSN